MVLHLKKAWILFTQECFCAKFGRNQSYSPVEEDYKFCQCIFAFSLFFPLRKKTWYFIWTTWISIHPRMLCAKFGWNWHSGSGEDFQISSMHFRHFGSIPLYFSKFHPLYQRMLCAKFLWNWPSFWGRQFFNFLNVFLLFYLIYPLKIAWPFIWKKWSLFTQGCFCAKFG